MNKLDKLKAKGWGIGSTQEFLNLTNAEMQLVELEILRLKRKR